MGKTTLSDGSSRYDGGGFSVTIRPDGAITVLPGDTLSKYSMAIYGNFSHLSEFKHRRNKPSGPITDADLVAISNHSGISEPTEKDAMEYILCRTCDQGNPAYLRLCGNCNSDLFAEINQTPAVPVEEDDPEMLRKWALRAIAISVFTTAFKIWFVYSLRQSAHQSFPNLTDISIIATPIIAAAIASFRINKWYRVLMFDSIVMAIIFVVASVLYIAHLVSR